MLKVVNGATCPTCKSAENTKRVGYDKSGGAGLWACEKCNTLFNVLTISMKSEKHLAPVNTKS